MAEIDLSMFTSADIDDLSKRASEDELDPIAHIRVNVAPCKRQISAAVSICRSISYYKYLSVYIRIDDRLSASCCSMSAIPKRLESLLSELNEGIYSPIFDQERSECIDRLWLEQRLYEIDDEADRDPIILGTQCSCYLRNVYNCRGLTSPLAAILLIGESNLIHKVMNTKPFHASPRVPQPNQFFRADGHHISATKHVRYVRKFLGSIDVSPKHKKAQAPAFTISSPAPQPSLKRGPEIDLGVESRTKRAITRSEPESEAMYS